MGRAWAAAFFFVPLIHTLYRQDLVSKEGEAEHYACGQQGRTDAVAEALLVEQSAILTRDDTPTLVAGSGEALEIRLAHLLGQPAPAPGHGDRCFSAWRCWHCWSAWSGSSSRPS